MCGSFHMVMMAGVLGDIFFGWSESMGNDIQPQTLTFSPVSPPDMRVRCSG